MVLPTASLDLTQPACPCCGVASKALVVLVAFKIFLDLLQ